MELRIEDGQALDLGTAALVDEASGWDLRMEGWNLFLNGGESGDGRAGGIDVDLLDLDLQYEELLRKNQLLYFFFFDSYGCPLSDWWWYGIDGTHTLFSNYHTYVVRQGDRSWAWQMLDYYRDIDGTAVAGYPSFRWRELGVGDSPIQVAEVDATAGGLDADADDPDNRWAYFDFDRGELDLSDEQSLDETAWHLAFKRFRVKSNSGPSGPGGVVSLDWDQDRSETPEDVLMFSPSTELPRFEARAAAWLDEPTDAFEEDRVRPVIERWHDGSGEAATVDHARWFLVGDRDGELLAKLRVLDLEAPTPDGPGAVTLQWALLD